MHLAAVSHDGKSNLNPNYAFNNSYKTLFNTLEILIKNNAFGFHFGRKYLEKIAKEIDKPIEL